MSSPAEVIKACKITFGMLADPDVAQSVAFSDNGVVKAISAGKRSGRYPTRNAVSAVSAYSERDADMDVLGRSYIDCSTVDEECSQKIYAAVTAAGGRFLEAPVSGR